MSSIWAWPSNVSKWAVIFSSYLVGPINFRGLRSSYLCKETKWAWKKCVHPTKPLRIDIFFSRRQLQSPLEVLLVSVSLGWLWNSSNQTFVYGVSQGVWYEDRRPRHLSVIYQNSNRIWIGYSHHLDLSCALMPSISSLESSLKLLFNQGGSVFKSSRPDGTYSPLSLSMKGCLQNGMKYHSNAATFNSVIQCKSLVPLSLMLWNFCLVHPSLSPRKIFTEWVTGLLWIPLLNHSFKKRLQFSSHWERSLSPPSSSFTERSLSPPSFSFMERTLLSSVLLAMILALRAFVDHLVAFGLKKVAPSPTFRQSLAIRNFGQLKLVFEVLANEMDSSSTSDKDYISVNMFLDSWNLVFPFKLKDVTNDVCISRASILLLSFLRFNIVVAFYFSSPTVLVLVLFLPCGV